PGMRDEDLNALFQPPVVPGFPLGRINIGPHHSARDSFGSQNLFQPCSHVSFLRVHSEDLAAASFRQLLLDLFDQPAFFGVGKFLGQVFRICNQESLPPAIFIGLKAVQLARGRPSDALPSSIASPAFTYSQGSSGRRAAIAVSNRSRSASSSAMID